MSFYERYEKCCKMQGIQPASQAAAEKIGCTRSNISTFAKNKTTPKGDIVARAASMLKVSSDYLLGLTDTPKSINTPLSEDDFIILRLVDKLNKQGKSAAIAMLTGLTEQSIFSKQA